MLSSDLTVLQVEIAPPPLPNLSFMPTPEDPRLFSAQCEQLPLRATPHQNPWFSVRQRGDFFTVEPTHAVVMVVPIVNRESLVLVEVKRDVLGDQRSLEIPAGGLEQGESGAAGAARELREETGIAASPERMEPLPPLALSPRNPRLAHVYQVHLSAEEFAQRQPHDHEISAVRVHSFVEVQVLLLNGEIYVGGVVGVLGRFLLGQGEKVRR